MKIALNVTIYVLALFAVVSFEACNVFDDDDKAETELGKLPEATQEGKNTFGCLVDGKALVPERSIDAWSYYQDGRLSIIADLKTSKSDQGISIRLTDEDLKEITYTLSQYPTNYGQFVKFLDETASCGYFTGGTYTGSLTITHFDNINHIVSGKFEFDAYSDDCDKSLKITQGRFDLNYTP